MKVQIAEAEKTVSSQTNSKTPGGTKCTINLQAHDIFRGFCSCSDGDPGQLLGFHSELEIHVGHVLVVVIDWGFCRGAPQARYFSGAEKICSFPEDFPEEVGCEHHSHSLGCDDIVGFGHRSLGCDGILG